jgi:hypothetical protein
MLHVLDHTTPADSVEILARLLGREEYRLVALGHRSTQELVRAAGVREPITFVHSMGWADPTGWRGTGRVIRDYQPTHVHAWGVPAGMAVAMSRFGGARLMTLVDLPGPRHLQLLPCIHKGGLIASRRECHWTVTTTWLKRELHSHSIPADAVTLIRAGADGAAGAGRNGVREELGLLPEDGPILLLGGDGGSTQVLAPGGTDARRHGGRGGPRHDLGLWAAGILQLIFPRIRAVVREDPRGRMDPGLERLVENLPDVRVPVVAPREWPWAKLLTVAQVMLVTPDGPLSPGSLMQAFAAGVPVIGTPVEAVREHIVHGHNGLIAKATTAREIAAAVEVLLGDARLQQKLVRQAREDLAAKYDGEAMLRAYERAYTRSEEGRPSQELAEAAPVGEWTR